MLHTHAMYSIHTTTHTFSVLLPTKNRQQRNTNCENPLPPLQCLLRPVGKNVA